MTLTTDAAPSHDEPGPQRSSTRRLVAAGVVASVGLTAALVMTLGGDRLRPEPQPVGAPGAWNTTFTDEFSGEALDRDVWSDHESWEGGGYSLDEALAPVPSGADQLEVRDGSLVLKARRADGLPDDKDFTSSAVHTRDGFSLPRGATTYVEARLKAPSGKGLLPAFWLLGSGDDSTGQGWPITGEVDILEFANNAGESGRPYFSVWYPRDVYEDPPGTFLDGVHDTHPDSFERDAGLRDSWHVWGLYRSPEKMEVFIDGVRRFTFRRGEVHNTGLPLPDMLFENAMHLRLSLAVGGDWAGAGWSAEQYEEGELAVDYVRAWNAED